MKRPSRELAADHAASYRIEGEPQREIKGYATPKPSLIAVSFDVRFMLKRVEPMENGSDGKPGSIRLAAPVPTSS